MDRGRQHRTLLKPAPVLGMVAAGLFAGLGMIRAQGPAGPVPSVAVPPPAPTASAAPDARKRAAVEKAMVERRQHDLTAEQEAQHRIEQLPPEERPRFERNLRVWGQLPPAEREQVRKEENERVRAEIEKAYQESGLHLDKDQREVFALRYRQERRRLERELQEKIEAERARRLPGIIDGLKKEFADRAVASVPTPTPPPSSSSPAGSKSTPSVSVPAASPR